MIRTVIIAAAYFIIACAADIALSPRMMFGVIRPSFLLTAAICLSAKATYESAAVIGFFQGLLQSAAIGDKRFAEIAAGIAACMLGTRLCSRDLELTPVTAAGVVGICTVLARIIELFVGLPPNPNNIFGWVPATIGIAIYNGLCAVPMYFVMRKVPLTAARA